MTTEPLTRADMDIVGEQFGVRIKRDAVPNAPKGMRAFVELYVEDDGLYHFKASFNEHWIDDLERVMEATKRRLASRYRTKRTEEM